MQVRTTHGEQSRRFMEGSPKQNINGGIQRRPSCEGQGRKRQPLVVCASFGSVQGSEQLFEVYFALPAGLFDRDKTGNRASQQRVCQGTEAELQERIEQVWIIIQHVTDPV